MSGSVAITVAGEDLVLLSEKAAYWPAGGTLFVADLHFGKADSFRAGGIAVPTASIHADLRRLGSALDATGATRLAMLGDLFHDRASKSPEVLGAVGVWLAARPALDVLLVRGNHDERSGDPPEDWRVECVTEPYPLGPFALRHYPEPTAGLYTLAGHVHPGVTLTGTGRQRLRLPCFHFTTTVGTLPAFGGFTGTADVRRSRLDRTFVVADGEVIPV